MLEACLTTLYEVQARHPRVAEPSGEGCCTCAYTPSSVSGCDSPVNLTPHKSKAAVDELFATLRDVAGARRLMKQFKSVHVPGSHAHQASACPFKVGGWREFPKLPCAQNSDHGCPWNSGRRPGKDQVPSRALLGLGADGSTRLPQGAVQGGPRTCPTALGHSLYSVYSRSPG